MSHRLRHVDKALHFSQLLIADFDVFVAFYQYARQQIVLESLNFFLQVHKYRTLSLSQRIAEEREIVSEYLQVQAPQKINIEGEVYRQATFPFSNFSLRPTFDICLCVPPTPTPISLPLPLPIPIPLPLLFLLRSFPSPFVVLVYCFLFLPSPIPSPTFSDLQVMGKASQQRGRAQTFNIAQVACAGPHHLAHLSAFLLSSAILAAEPWPAFLLTPAYEEAWTKKKTKPKQFNKVLGDVVDPSVYLACSRLFVGYSSQVPFTPEAPHLVAGVKEVRPLLSQLSVMRSGSSITEMLTLAVP